jgi:DNA mismatch repair protein MSH2
VFLAHIESFVPCDAAVIWITVSIHARVGAWDSFQMSTFTVGMTEMASILESAQSSSPAIIDELGRSTRCGDAFGLAWALSKRLAARIASFCLFATQMVFLGLRFVI